MLTEIYKNEEGYNIVFPEIEETVVVYGADAKSFSELFEAREGTVQEILESLGYTVGTIEDSLTDGLKVTMEDIENDMRGC